MTLHSHTTFAIPEATARVARAAYPNGNIYMQMRLEIRPGARPDGSRL
jgi:hypothetical protein